MWQLFFLLIPLLGVGYVGWHVWHILPLAAPWRWAAVTVIVLSIALTVASFHRSMESLPLKLATAMYETAFSALFILLYLFMAFVLLDVLRLLHIVPSAWLNGNGWTSLAITAVLLAVFVGGNMHYNNKVRRSLTLTTTKDIGQKPVKIVMMSDLHLGYHNRRKELARWVDMVNREQPDMVLLGGDLIDISVRPLLEQDMAQELRRLAAPVYACPGNHEYYSGMDKAEQLYRAAGITLLRDGVAHVGKLTIVGRDDRTNTHRKSLRRLMADVDATSYTLLLDHQPYHLESAEKAGVDFQFSGHTHRGQVWPISWITDALYECSFGEHHRGRTDYYVSSGMGIWGGKFRIGTCSEYIVLTLKGQ